MSKNIRRGLILAALIPAVMICGDAAFASGGTVKLQTDNSADGYYYNSQGNAAGRYASLYLGGEFDINAIICGIRATDLDQSVVTAGVDDYVLGADIRFEDPNCPGYADLTVVGLLADGDPNSLLSCTTNSTFGTQTFGGGAGICDPLANFLLTKAQPANNDPNEGLDFCGVNIDHTSLWSGRSRTMTYAPSPPPCAGAPGFGFNHMLEAIVFEPKEIDLNIGLGGSARFPGDRGLPSMFARRECDLIGNAKCLQDGTDLTTNNKTDDFISAKVVVDNNTPAAPRTLNVVIEADRSPINPKLGPKDVTNFFKIIGSNAGIMNPVTFPNGRTIFNLEIRLAIRRKFLGFFPVNLPFIVRVEDTGDPNIVPDGEAQLLGLRRNAGNLDDDSHGAGQFLTQSPVLTGDALTTELAAADLPKPGSTTNVAGIRVVGGGSGTAVAGVNVELRTEDPVLTGSPDLSPQGLLRNAGPNTFGPAPSTVVFDITDYIANPSEAALANNLIALVLLNPGDTFTVGTSVTGYNTGDVLVQNAGFLVSNTNPILGILGSALEIGLDMNGEIQNGNPAQPRVMQGNPIENPNYRVGNRVKAIDDQRRSR